MNCWSVARSSATRPAYRKCSLSHHAREENRSQLLEVVGHRLSPLFDVVPAQGRAGDDENEAEK